MASLPPLLYALLLHGVLGFLDVVVNHELLAKLPARREAVEEEILHAAREAIFACLFISLAWTAWYGDWSWWIAALLLAEVAVSTRDVVVEGNIRLLPVSERLLHLLLFINLGVMITLAASTLLAWHALPTALVRADHGWASWALTLLALGAAAWALRDALAGRRLRRAQPT